MRTQAIRASRLIGKRPTLDLRVDHPDHNYLAEGIVVSNSHSVSYGYLTAASTYMKANHMAAFYLHMLRLAREEPNPIEYTNTILGEMRAHTSIQILPPDITRSSADFQLEPDTEHPSIQHIRFGLSSIKGVSDATMVKLAAFKRTFTSKLDVFDAAREAGVPINVVVSLIYSGCLHWGGVTRTKLALEAQTYNLLSDGQKGKVRQFIGQYEEDVIATLKALPTILTEKGKPVMPESQLATLRKHWEPFYAQYLSNSRNEELAAYVWERETLGYSHTSSLHRCFSKKIIGLVEISEVLERGRAVAAAKEEADRAGERAPRPDPFQIVAFVEEAKLNYSQKDKSPYYKLRLVDDSGGVSALCYGPERIEACKRANEGELPKEGEIVTCEGTFSRDGGIMFADTLIVQPSPIQTKRAPKGTPPPI